MKKAEQIKYFNIQIANATSIKKLDDIYNQILYSNLDNQTFQLYDNMIKIKVENLILSDLAS